MPYSTLDVLYRGALVAQRRIGRRHGRLVALAIGAVDAVRAGVTLVALVALATVGMREREQTARAERRDELLTVDHGVLQLDVTDRMCAERLAVVNLHRGSQRRFRDSRVSGAGDSDTCNSEDQCPRDQCDLLHLFSSGSVHLRRQAPAVVRDVRSGDLHAVFPVLDREGRLLWPSTGARQEQQWASQPRRCNRLDRFRGGSALADARNVIRAGYQHRTEPRIRNNFSFAGLGVPHSTFVDFRALRHQRDFSGPTTQVGRGFRRFEAEGRKLTRLGNFPPAL